MIESRKQGGMGAAEAVPFGNRAAADAFAAANGGKVVDVRGDSERLRARQRQRRRRSNRTASDVRPTDEDCRWHQQISRADA